MAVQVRDVAAPRHLALPAYAGQAYIFGTLMAGAVWALSGGSVIGLSLLIYVSGLGGWRGEGGWREGAFWRAHLLQMYVSSWGCCRAGLRVRG